MVIRQRKSGRDVLRIGRLHDTLFDMIECTTLKRRAQQTKAVSTESWTRSDSEVARLSPFAGESPSE